MKSFGLKELAEHCFATESEVIDYVAASDYEKLKADYDSILAELQKANATIIDLQRNPPKLAKEFLAEIKAEAVKAFADEIGVFSREYDDQGYVEVAKWKVQEHIAKVRQGEQSGTWLKDSNVNGGKRQGGEK